MRDYHLTKKPLVVLKWHRLFIKVKSTEPLVVRKDMDVNEHETLSSITLNIIK